MGNMGITRVLVTGSEGYIGAVLVPLLISEGYEVVGVDACYYGTSGNSGYPLLRKDVRHITPQDLDGIHAIIHLGALSNDPMGELDERLTREINFEASIRLATLAKASSVKRFLFSSSCSIYGKTENGVVDENSPVLPLTAYAKSKIAAEDALKSLASDGFTVGILRNATVYGYSPMFRDDLVVNNLVATALRTGVIIIKSDGTPWRPLIDVRDLAAVFVAFLSAPSSAINGEVINVGFTQNNVQVKDIADLVGKLLPKSTVSYTGEHGADTRSYRVNFDKFMRIFPHIKQQWTLSDSIADMIAVLTSPAKKQDSHTHTRIAALQLLIREKKLDNDFFAAKSMD